MARLTIESGSQRGKQFKLPESGAFTIGRDEKCNICIDDKMASRVHCVVRCEQRKWVIDDDKSTNGIRVNDVPVNQHTLIPGDTIEIGDTLISLATDDEDPLIGSTLAGYEIDRRLGRGAMGTVYLARQLSLDRPVALKILAPRFSKDEDFIKSFLEEARAAGRLNHPNVVQVYDAGNEGDHHYMSMEYLEGGSLEELLEREGQLDIIRAVDAARDAAQALQFAQQNQIVHRDIKPANLMLTLDGTVKVGDLGIAADLSQTGTAGGGGNTPAAGSPRYMAPEQAQGEALDHRADIYALGATLYRMIAGVAPFDGASVKEIIRAKLDNDPTPLRRLVPEIPGGLSAVVQKMLARNPDSRYDNADQVFSALDPSQYRKGISAKGKARAARAASVSQGARPAGGRSAAIRQRRPAQGSQSNLVVGSVIGIVALVLILVLVSKSMNDEDDGAGRSKTAEPRTTQKKPVESKKPAPGLERDASKIALKELKSIEALYSKGELEASAALLRLENLLGDNPRITAPAEKLLKELRSKAELARKAAIVKRKEAASAELVAIDVLLGKKELRKADEALTGFLARNSELGAELVSAPRAKLGKLVRAAMDAAGKQVTEMVTNGDFEKARTEIVTLRVRMPSSEESRLQSMAAEVSLAESRMANSLKFVEDNRDGVFELLADLDFSGAKKHLDDIIGKFGGLDKIANKEAKALLAMLGKQVYLSRKVWEELQAIFSESVKSKSLVKIRVLSAAKDDKEQKYKVLGVEGPAVRVQESGSKAVPAAHRTLGLDANSIVALMGKPGRAGLEKADIIQGLGMLLLLRDGPGRGRELLLGEKPAEGDAYRKENERLLAKYADSWRETRLFSLQKLESKLSADKKPVPADLWNFIATDAGVLIRAWKSRADYAKVRSSLHELFLRARIAALAGASVEAAFNAKTVKEGKNGLTTLTYDFSSMEQLQDFYPVGGGGTTIDWVEKKRFFKLKGEVRFLAANPFESRIAINGVVPNGGYNAAAPNVNVALWTEENDRVTAPRAFNYNAWRESNETGEPPADYFALGMGYKPEVSLGGILGEGRLGGLARTLTGFLPGYLRESSFALLAGEHGVGLHSRRDEKIWSQPVGSLLRPGTIRFSISMENSALKWKVNSKSLGYRNSLALARLAEKIPHVGSFNIFTNNSTVYFSSLEITGQISKEWAAGLAKSIAERELKKLDSSFGRGADGKADGAKSDTSSGAGGGKGTGTTPGPGSNQGGASSGGLKGVMERFDKNGDGKLDENERKAFQDLLREGLGSEPDSSPEKKEPAGSAGQGSSS